MSPSLHVAVVARRLTENLIRKQTRETEHLGLDPEVVEAAALAHDLGHPPFGHVGEAELDTLFTENGLADGFGGEAQSFRVVTKLAFSSPQYPGLNLTRATLNGVLRYPWVRGPYGRKGIKWGAYSTEQTEASFARELSRADERRCVEAELMDWADDITSAVYDVVDFYRAGRIPLERLSSEKSERARFLAGVFMSPNTEEMVWRHSRENLEGAFENLMALFPFDDPYIGTSEQESRALSLRAALASRYAGEIKLDTAEDSSDFPGLVASAYRIEVFMLKQLVWYYVYNDPALASRSFVREN